MRLVANALPNKGVKRLMIHVTEHSVYLFGFNRVPDGGGMWDEWYETVADAKEAGKRLIKLLWNHGCRYLTPATNANKTGFSRFE